MFFPEGNQIVYSQDFSQYIGVPAGIDFEVTRLTADSVILRAPGYGAKRPYGNGPLIVHRGMQAAAQHNVQPTADADTTTDATHSGG